MKKFFLIAIVLIAVTGVKAQNEGFSIAPKIGVNIAKISGFGSSCKSLTGLNIGITGQYRFENSFAIESGLIYSQQGVKVFLDGGGRSYFKERINYINIPVLAKYYITKGLNVFAGPGLGFCVSKGSLTYFKDFDLAANVGAGYEFDFGLLLQANYNISLTKLSKYSDNKYRNNVFQGSAGWRFL